MEHQYGTLLFLCHVHRALSQFQSHGWQIFPFLVAGLETRKFECLQIRFWKRIQVIMLYVSLCLQLISFLYGVCHKSVTTLICMQSVNFNSLIFWWDKRKLMKTLYLEGTFNIFQCIKVRRLIKLFLLAQPLY